MQDASHALVALGGAALRRRGRANRLLLDAAAVVLATAKATTGTYASASSSTAAHKRRAGRGQGVHGRTAKPVKHRLRGPRAGVFPPRRRKGQRARRGRVAIDDERVGFGRGQRPERVPARVKLAGAIGDVGCGEEGAG